MKRNPDYSEEELTLSVSVCPPACRMVVCSSFFMEENDQIVREISPVVAIESRVVSRYFTNFYGQRDSRGFGSHNDFMEAGWKFGGQRIDQTALIVDSEYGVVDYQGFLMECSNAERALVVCSWQESEDESRLVKIWAELDSVVKEKCERRKRPVQAVTGVVQ